MALAVVILAAGQGTRMKSHKAKVLHELLGKPLLAYPVDLALTLKAERTVVVVGHQAEAVKAMLSTRYGGRVATAFQAEQLGTGHAVLCSKAAFKGFAGTVVIIQGDIPGLKAETVTGLLRAVVRSKSPLGLLTAKLDDPFGYGRIVRDENGKVLRSVEQRDGSPEELAVREVNTGIYAVDAGFLFKNLPRLGNANDQGEYYLPDLIGLAVKQGHRVVTRDVDGDEMAGINDRAQLAKAERKLALEIIAAHQKNGVSIENPETVVIGPEVELGYDTVIEANCRLLGRSTVGNGSTIQAGSILVDSALGHGVRVQPYTVIEESRVEHGAILGPFAHLRPGSKIGPGCHVGNFVETKKAELMAGAKANHLSYIGDAVIGRRTNVGAGTITCNYDGYAKYRTEVGDDVLIGSDTQLIAPVTVPNRVVLGAGSSLTGKTDIPEGALVVTRATPVVIPGFRDKLEARSLAKAQAKKAESSVSEAKTKPRAKAKKRFS